MFSFDILKTETNKNTLRISYGEIDTHKEKTDCEVDIMRTFYLC